jgi:long-chain acyl-CoA synthetase
MAVVIAQSRRFPSALIVPNLEKLRQYADEHGLGELNNADLVEHENINQLFMDEISSTCAELARYELPKKVIVIDREFSIEEGEITPTMKVKRRVVEIRFQRQIDELYA